MPEKVRRIKRKQKIHNLRWKRWVFFILLLAALAVLFILPDSREAPPADTAALKIQDTSAVAALCTQTECSAVNKDGVVFEHISQPSGNLLFRIDLPQKESVMLGNTPFPAESMAELLFIRQQLKEQNIHLATATALTHEETDFDMQTQEGWVLKVNTQNNAPATVRITRQTLAELDGVGRQLDYIDVRLPSRVYYAFKE